MIEGYLVSGGVRPQGYGFAFVSHLERGDATTRAVVRALAVLGPERTGAELAELAGVSEAEASTVLTAMNESGLLGEGYFRTQVARLAVLGALARGERERLLPTCAFQHRRYWLEASIVTGTAENAAQGLTDESTREPGEALAARLAGLTPDDRFDVLTDVVRAEAAAVLGHDGLEEIEENSGFFDIGFTSLTARSPDGGRSGCSARPRRRGRGSGWTS